MNEQCIGNRVNAERIEIKSESSNLRVFLLQFNNLYSTLTDCNLNSDLTKNELSPILPVLLSNYYDLNPT